MIILAVACLIGLVLEYFEQLSTVQVKMIGDFELFVGLVFLADFGFELLFAKDRFKYWRAHWIFLIASVPLPGQLFDVMRGLWLLRILRLFKVFSHLRYEQNTWLTETRRP